MLVGWFVLKINIKTVYCYNYELYIEKNKFEGGLAG